MAINIYEEAKKYRGTADQPGSEMSNPIILSWLQDNNDSVTDDDTAWCSAFVNFICKECGMERSHSNRARSWLEVGKHIDEVDAQEGDIVILKRGKAPQPGSDVIKAPGHVGFFSHYEDDLVWILGGNQHKHHGYDEVCEKHYDRDDILGIRRVSSK